MIVYNIFVNIIVLINTMIGNHIKFDYLLDYYKVHSLKYPVQIFTGSPRSFYRKNKNYSEIKELIKSIPLYVHSSYVINIGSNEKSISYLEKELTICNEINAKGLVIHVSKSLKKDKIIAIKDMCLGIFSILKFMHNNSIKTKLLLETPSGQGSELLTNIEEFVIFCKTIKESDYGNLFGIVVDTCHVYSLGYNPDDFIIELMKNKLKIDLIHFNDSKTQKGSKIDRHAIVFKGNINHKNLENCITLIKKYKIDAIYE